MALLPQTASKILADRAQTSKESLSWRWFKDQVIQKAGSKIEDFLSTEYHQLILWLPVFLGLGIVLFFHVPQISRQLVGVIAAGGLLAFFRAFFATTLRARCFWAGLFLIVLGFQAAFWRTQILQTPMLKRTYGPCMIEGVVEELHTLGPHKTRCILKLAKPIPLQRGKPKPPPVQRIRLYLLPTQKKTSSKKHSTQALSAAHHAQPPRSLQVGQKVRLLTKLQPIPGPTWPGGYAFRRVAFYEGLGGKGFALSHPKIIENASEGSPPNPSFKARFQKGVYHFSLGMERLRRNLENSLYQTLSKDTASVSAALLCGKKAGISAWWRQQFARSGIAHLLAISGLHMAIVAGLVFFWAQTVMALVPLVAMRFALHKVAALVTLPLTFFYLQLSGSATPAFRAFLMTSIVMLGLLINRWALSLRLVAFAATVLLLYRPENLLGASFQLSFAAVTALIGGFEALRQRRAAHKAESTKRAPRLEAMWGGQTLLFLGGIMLSTLVAGLATAPYTLFHFGQFSFLGSLANLVAIPLTTFIIMPLGLVFSFSACFGLHGITAPLFESSLKALLGIAQTIGHMPLASLYFPSAHPFWLWPLTLGGLWFLVFQSRLRYGGLAVFLVGFAGLFIPHAPTLLMDSEGKALGLYDRPTRTLWATSHKKGLFAQKTWMQATGAKHRRTMPFESLKRPSQAPPQTPQAPPLDWRCTRDSCFVTTRSGHTVLFSLEGREAPFCSAAHIALALQPFRWRCSGQLLTLDYFSAWRHGAWAIYLGKPSFLDRLGQTFQIYAARMGLAFARVFPFRPFPQNHPYPSHHLLKTHQSPKKSHPAPPKKQFGLRMLRLPGLRPLRNAGFTPKKPLPQNDLPQLKPTADHFPHRQKVNNNIPQRLGRKLSASAPQKNSKNTSPRLSRSGLSLPRLKGKAVCSGLWPKQGHTRHF